MVQQTRFVAGYAELRWAQKLHHLPALQRNTGASECWGGSSHLVYLQKAEPLAGMGQSQGGCVGASQRKLGSLPGFSFSYLQDDSAPGGPQAPVYVYRGVLPGHSLQLPD